MKQSWGLSSHLWDLILSPGSVRMELNWVRGHAAGTYYRIAPVIRVLGQRPNSGGPKKSGGAISSKHWTEKVMGKSWEHFNYYDHIGMARKDQHLSLVFGVVLTGALGLSRGLGRGQEVCIIDQSWSNCGLVGLTSVLVLRRGSGEVPRSWGDLQLFRRMSPIRPVILGRGDLVSMRWLLLLGSRLGGVSTWSDLWGGSTVSRRYRTMTEDV